MKKHAKPYRILMILGLLATGGREVMAENRADTAAAIKGDGRGGVYIAGSTHGVFEGVQSGAADAWIARFNAVGKQVWVDQFGSAAGEIAVGLGVDAAGNAYVAGQTHGFIHPSQTSQGKSDIWLARFSPQGQQQWVRQFGSAGFDGASDVEADKFGNTYVVGYTTGNLGGPNVGGNDIWIAKYSSSGAQMWVKQFGSPMDDFAYGVSISPQGQIILSGFTEGTLGARSFGGRDLWIASFSPNGNRLWVRQWGGAGDDSAASAAVTPDGRVVLCGYTYSSLSQQKKGGGADVWLAMFSALGVPQWTRQIDTGSTEVPQSVAVGNNRIYTVGYVSSLTGVHEAWMVIHDLTGKLVGGKVLRTENNEVFNAVDVDATGGVFVTGEVEVDLADGSEDMDALYFRFNANGLPTLSRQLSGITAPLPAINPGPFVLHEVAPQATDAGINDWTKNHVVFYTGAASRDGRLVVFLPGTDANARMYTALLKAFASRGYSVIGLNYPNTLTVDNLCDNGANGDCYEQVRFEVLTGQDTSSQLAIMPANSIQNRLYKLLLKLQADYPSEGWGAWVDNVNQAPVWSNIIVSGHSQGAGYAAFVGKVYKVARAVMIAGPADVLSNGSPVPWITAAGPTPMSDYVGFGHLADPFYPRYEPNWVAMGLGGQTRVDTTIFNFSGVRNLISSIPPADGKATGLKCHNSLAVDQSTPFIGADTPLYEAEQVWRYIVEKN